MTTATSDGLRVTLRPYQTEALERVDAAERRGVRRQLGVAATGLGKTIMFCALAEQRQARTLVLVHRDELVRQTVTKMREVWPDVDVGVVKAAEDEIDAHVVVASVQTLARQRRLDRLLAAPESLLRDVRPFDLVVVDEAHHAAADTYRRVLAALAAHDPLVLGVTATPDRGDGKGLDDDFDEITFTYDILWGIEAGYLADVRGLRVVLDQFDIGDVKVSRGDYDAGSAGRALDDADAPAFIVKAWREHASDRQTLVFTPTVDLAEHVAGEFRSKGIAAGFVSAATPLEDRRALLGAYARGDVQVIANCAVLTEGYDNPRTDCIVVARPTKSRALFTQMIGRGTRRHPDKADLLVLDVVGASHDHSLVTIPSLFGFDAPEWAGLGDGSMLLTDAVTARDRQAVLAGRMRAEDADLFRGLRGDGIAWVQVHQDGDMLRRYQRAMRFRGRDGFVTLPTVVLTQTRPEEHAWLAGLIMPDGQKRVLIADVDMEMAQGVAEDHIRRTQQRYRVAGVSTEAPWRAKPPSDRAIAFARRLKLDPSRHATAGELADAIDGAMARKEISRKTKTKGPR